MKLRLTALTIFSAALLGAGSFAHSQAEDKGSAVSAAQSEVSILAYNVENLFDTEQDNVNDITFLPLAKKNTKDHFKACMKIQNDSFRDECLSFDWSEELLTIKVKRIVDVVLSIEGGNGPDILLLEEVENIKILSRLMQEMNKRLPNSKAYLEPILLEGWDDRGIDVAMFSRLKRVAEPRIYPVKIDGKIADSRGILHSVFKLPSGEKLNVFGVHSPSGGNPTEHREAAIVALNAELEKIPKSEYAIAGGDFNINVTEDAVRKLYPNQLGSEWLVSHLIGCNHCSGTNFYTKEQTWSFLDALLFSKNMSNQSSGWVVDAQSIDVPNSGPEQTWKGKPSRFSADHGVSDHWPIYAKIRKK